MTNHRNKQNYRFRTLKFRDRCHLKGGVRQGCFLSLILNYLIQYIHFHSLYIMSHYYAKFKENPCVGTDASTPLSSNSSEDVDKCMYAAVQNDCLIRLLYISYKNYGFDFYIYRKMYFSRLTLI